jgi:hypothetical protein
MTPLGFELEGVKVVVEMVDDYLDLQLPSKCKVTVTFVQHSLDKVSGAK